MSGPIFPVNGLWSRPWLPFLANCQPALVQVDGDWDAFLKDTLLAILAFIALLHHEIMASLLFSCSVKMKEAT